MSVALKSWPLPKHAVALISSPADTGELDQQGTSMESIGNSSAMTTRLNDVP